MQQVGEDGAPFRMQQVGEDGAALLKAGLLFLVNQRDPRDPQPFVVFGYPKG
jgi:hypothetical protein